LNALRLSSGVGLLLESCSVAEDFAASCFISGDELGIGEDAALAELDAEGFGSVF